MKIAVVGCGYWGKNLVRNFHEMGVLRHVCDATPAGRRLAAELAPTARVVADASDVFDGDVTGVAIATPAATHFALAEKALLADKDVFVEKPLALTYDEGARLVDLAEERGRILMVGHVLEYHPAVDALRRMVEDDELGKIRYVYSNRLSLGKIRREENILWSFAPHDIAVILQLVRGELFQVVACGGSYVQPNVADVTVTNLLFDNGVRAHVFVSWLHPFKEQRLVVVGEKKMASFDDVAKRLVLYDQRVDLENGEPIPVKGEGTEVAFPSDEPLRIECEAFVHAMQTREPPRTDGRSGLRVLNVLQAAQRSLMTNGQATALRPEPRPRAAPVAP